MSQNNKKEKNHFFYCKLHLLHPNLNITMNHYSLLKIDIFFEKYYLFLKVQDLSILHRY